MAPVRTELPFADDVLPPAVRGIELPAGECCNQEQIRGSCKFGKLLQVQSKTNISLKTKEESEMKSAWKLCLIAFLATSLVAQTSTQPKPKKAKAATITAADVQALKDAIAAQQSALASQEQQIQALQDELHRKDQATQQAQASATDAAAKADAAQAQASQDQQAVVALKSDVTEIKTTTNNTATTLQESLKEVKNVDEMWESPMSLHLKGITITPAGFVEAAFVRRSRELGADLPTPFNSLTMPGASQSNLSDFFASARQSRASVFFGGRLSNVELQGYISTDFLASGVTASATQTNSYQPRLRQAWGQAKFNNGWKFLGGQAWSLVTENRAGIAPSDDNGKVNDARPATIDPQYNVGFTFARQAGIRVTKDFGDKVSVAFAVENPQGTLTTHGNEANYLIGEAGANNSYNTTSNYTANPSPDLIAKIAFDPGFGHYEIFGLADRFTGRVFPCVAGGPFSLSAECTATDATTATGAFNHSKEGGGFGANARWNFANKHVVFGLHGFGGSAIGRYGAAQLSDVSINPDGTVHLIKDLQGLVTLEYHGKKLDIYSYVGSEYAARTYGSYLNPVSTKTQYVGYGSPTFANYGCYVEQPPATGVTSGVTTTAGYDPGALANCTADTRAMIEGTVGFWYRFYNGPKGKFQFGTQYSYVTRQTWSGATAAPTGGTATPGALSPEGIDGMVFTSFRYYLP
jgi:hypothetical protein